MSRVGESTKREDRRALVDAGKRYHAAKLAYLYANPPHEQWKELQLEFEAAAIRLQWAAEVYAVGRKKESVEYGHEYGHKWYQQTKRQEGK